MGDQELAVKVPNWLHIKSEKFFNYANAIGFNVISIEPVLCQVHIG